MAKYDMHPLSLLPGGDTLVFVFSDGKSETRTRIKYISKYVIKVVEENPDLIHVFNKTTNETLYSKLKVNL